MENGETKDSTELALLAESGVLMPDSPMVVPDGMGNEIAISPQQFIKFYLPKNSTPEEQFHCYMQTRATGLNPMIPGECHYFPTGDKPISLFTGYPVYVRKAYAGDLKHIETPDIEFGEDGKPISCTITLQFKSDRPDFVWPTWFDEVASRTKSGSLNSRWQKAPNQMFIKCSVVNTLRMSGLVDFSLPYAVEEMDNPPAVGFRTLTPEQLEEHGVEALPEATPGEVSADYHEDVHPMRKIYRGKIAEREIFIDDAQRKQWQLEIIGKESTKDWDGSDFLNAVSEIESGKSEKWAHDKTPKPDPEPPPGAAQEPPDKPVDDAGGADTQAEPEEDDKPQKITLLTRKALSKIVKEFPGAKYMTVASRSFKERAAEEIGRNVTSIEDYTEAEGLAIIESLEKEKATIGKDDDPAWFDSPEYMLLDSAFIQRVQGKWANIAEMFAWQEEHTGIGSRRYWRQENFDKANVRLDTEEAAQVASAAQAGGTAQAQEAAHEETTNGGSEKLDMVQSDEIYKLLAKLLPGAIDKDGDSIASTTHQARQWISDAIKRPNPGIANLKSSEADRVIEHFKGILSDRAAEALSREVE